jgi:hypothetical protein
LYTDSLFSFGAAAMEKNLASTSNCIDEEPLVSSQLVNKGMSLNTHSDTVVESSDYGVKSRKSKSTDLSGEPTISDYMDEAITKPVLSQMSKYRQGLSDYKNS